MDPDFDFHTTLASAREGDPGALDCLIGRFYPQVEQRVHRSLATDLRSRRPWIGALFSTGDVVQEVFLSVLHNLADFEGSKVEEFVAFLVTLTRNRLIDAVRYHEAVCRDRRRVCDVDETTQANGPHQLDDAVIARDELVRFRQALAGFRERERVLLASRLEGRDRPPTFAALASQLGYPSADAARKACYSCQARLLLRLGEPEQS